MSSNSDQAHTAAIAALPAMTTAIETGRFVFSALDAPQLDDMTDWGLAVSQAMCNVQGIKHPSKMRVLITYEV